MVGVEDFKFFVDLTLQSCASVVNTAEIKGLFLSLLLGRFELCSGLASLLLDVGKKLEEVLGVFLEHLFGADETELSHLVEVSQAFDLLVFFLEQHLDQEHLSLFLNEVPSVLSVLWAFDRDVEASSLSNVDLVGDVWVNGQSCRLDVRFAELPQATLTSRSVFLPDFQFLIDLSLALLTSAFLVLKSEDAVVTRVLEGVRVLPEA